MSSACAHCVIFFPDQGQYVVVRTQLKWESFKTRESKGLDNAAHRCYNLKWYKTEEKAAGNVGTRRKGQKWEEMREKRE